MQTFKKFINLSEEFHTFVKSRYRENSEPTEVYLNPNTMELRHIRGRYGAIRMILDTKHDNLYAWDAGTLTHFEVLKQYDHTNEDLIELDAHESMALEALVNPEGYITHISITPGTRDTKWKHNPEAKNRILASKVIEPLCVAEMFTENDRIRYYDQAAYGPWDKLKV